ncbi:YqhG family protein, partial [Bacillus mycoides]|uniref:YqhG family protein n=1 Tax=Bacillus mycoides TaxID=1405 RepID=UPI003CC7D32F
MPHFTFTLTPIINPQTPIHPIQHPLKNLIPTHHHTSPQQPPLPSNHHLPLLNPFYQQNQHLPQTYQIQKQPLQHQYQPPITIQ